MARLGGRVAVIRVGAATETELAERRHRVDDAVQATRAALHEGIVPGGGAALLNAAGGDRRRRPRAGRGDRRRVVRRALEEPLRQIAAQRRLRPVRRSSARSAALGPGEGLDAATGSYCDLFEAGVIDPTLVTRSALEYAASIAKIVLVTECLVTRSALDDDLLEEAREAERHAHIRSCTGRRGRCSYGAEARATLLAAIDAVADTVKRDARPARPERAPAHGRSGGPTITNDGATIAGEIELGDSFANQGALLVRHVASATNTIAGDGTTTATVLAQAIVREGMQNVAAGADPMALRRGIEHAVDQAVRAPARGAVARDRDARGARARRDDLRRTTRRSAA